MIFQIKRKEKTIINETDIINRLFSKWFLEHFKFYHIILLVGHHFHVNYW